MASTVSRWAFTIGSRVCLCVCSLLTVSCVCKTTFRSSMRNALTSLSVDPTDDRLRIICEYLSPVGLGLSRKKYVEAKLKTATPTFPHSKKRPLPQRLLSATRIRHAMREFNTASPNMNLSLLLEGYIVLFILSCLTTIGLIRIRCRVPRSCLQRMPSDFLPKASQNALLFVA